MFKKQLIIVSILILLVQYSALAFSFNVDPSSVRVSSKPGQVVDGKIIVKNSGTTPIPVKAYVNDWKIEDDGAKAFYPAGSLPLSCANWLSIYPKDFSLAPGQEAVVNYVLTVPDTATGGHYAVIFFESLDQLSSKRSVSFSGRIGTIVYHKVEGKFTADGALSLAVKSSAKDITLDFSLNNKGNVYLDVRPTLAILDKNNKTVLRKAFARFGVMPGQSVRRSEVLEASLLPGDYTAVLTTEYEQNNFNIAEKTFKVNKFVSVEQPKSSGIDSLKVTKFSPVGSKDILKVFLNVENIGQNLIYMNASVLVFDEDKNQMGAYDIAKHEAVGQSSEKLLNQQFSHSLPAGKYSAVVQLTWDGGSSTYEESFSIEGAAPVAKEIKALVVKAPKIEAKAEAKKEPGSKQNQLEVSNVGVSVEKDNLKFNLNLKNTTKEKIDAQIKVNIFNKKGDFITSYDLQKNGVNKQSVLVLEKKIKHNLSKGSYLAVIEISTSMGVNKLNKVLAIE